MKEQPIINFNDFGTIKRLLGLGSLGSGSPDEAAPSDTRGIQTPNDVIYQPSQISFGRTEPIEEELEFRRTRLERAED